MRRPGAIPALLVPRGVPLLRDATEAAIRSMFGRPLDPARDPGDPGLFGPGSATWALLADPCAVVSGVGALLVQSLHPRAMAGVAAHGSFEVDLLGRLHRTAAYVQAVSCGGVDEAIEASLRARGAHRRVVGTTPDGQPYRADEPRLLAWVQLGLTLSLLSVWDLLGPHPVAREVADRFVAEQAVAAALLDARVDLAAARRDPAVVAALRRAGATGDLPLDLPMLRDDSLPRSLAELEAVLDGFLPELARDRQAAEAIAFLLDPPLSGAGRLGWRAVATAAVASLPAEIREVADVPADRLRDEVRIRAVRAGVDTLRVVHGRTSTVRRATARATTDPS